ILNDAGGLITTIIPPGGLPGFNNAVPNLSLSLVSPSSIINNGTIASANGLNLIAGQQIINAGSGGGQSHGAQITAQGTINIATPKLVNAATIASSTGNINIAPAVSSQAQLAAIVDQLASGKNVLSLLAANQSLVVDNEGGVLKAEIG